MERISTRVSVAPENVPAAMGVEPGTVIVQSYSGEYDDRTLSDIPDGTHVTDDDQDNPHYYRAFDNSYKTVAFDSDGVEDTHYQITGEITKTDEGTFDVAVGVYSVDASPDEDCDGEPDEVVSKDDFGYVAEFNDVEERYEGGLD